MTGDLVREDDDEGSLPERVSRLADIAKQAVRALRHLDRKITIGIAVLVVGVVAVGFYAYSVHSDLQKSQGATRRARFSVCVNDNNAAHQNIKQFDDFTNILASAIHATTDEGRLAVARFVFDEDLKTSANFPDRPCTPEGIANYYSHPPKVTTRPTLPPQPVTLP